MSVDRAGVIEPHAVILVEGMSDQAALEALAGRRGQALDADGISVVAMGGATNIERFVDRFGPHGLGVRLAGLCDAAEEGHFRRALERAGLGSGLSRPGMEALGFFVCVADLEDELIRALGTDASSMSSRRRARSARSAFPETARAAGPSPQRQLRRFMGTRSGRKSLYARLLVGRARPRRVPRPLDQVLAHAADGRNGL